MQGTIIGFIEYPPVEYLAEERNPWVRRFELTIETKDGLIVTEECDDNLYLIARLDTVIRQGGTGHITDQLAAGDGIIARRWIRKPVGMQLAAPVEHRRQA